MSLLTLLSPQGAAVIIAPEVMYWGLLHERIRRSRKDELDAEEALEIIEADGTAAEREHAAALEAEQLIYRLVHAKRLLTDEQKRHARSEARWAMAVAQRIERDRDDEDVIALALLLD